MRALLAAALGAVLGLLLPSLSATEPARVVVAVTLVVVVAAVFALRPGATALLGRVLRLQSLAADEDRSQGSEQATDPVHSPLRPRAPGLV